MGIPRIIIGILATTLIFGTWVTAGTNLSDSQMSQVWGGGPGYEGYLCDTDTNEGGCDSVPTRYSCNWVEENEEWVCTGKAWEGYCNQPQHNGCYLPPCPASTTCSYIDDGETCAYTTYEEALCHVIVYNICGTYYPQDFYEVNCTGSISECADN